MLFTLVFILSLLFIWTNLLIVFYTLMCRNHLEIGKNAKGALLEVDSDFSEICSPLKISEIVCLRPEDDMN